MTTSTQKIASPLAAHVTISSVTLCLAAVLFSVVFLGLAGCSMRQRLHGASVSAVTIEPGASPVTEGTAVQFTVQATPAPADDLLVSIQVTDAGTRLAAFTATSGDGPGRGDRDHAEVGNRRRRRGRGRQHGDRDGDRGDRLHARYPESRRG